MPSIPCAALMCHAPIVIPAVGGARGEDCRATTTAMAEAARCLVAQAPDVIVLCSPHTPRSRSAFGVVDGAVVRGDLARFGTPEVRVELPACEDARAALLQAAAEEGVAAERIDPGPLDHGAMVPLAFLWDAGWRGRTLVFAFPARSAHDDAVLMGRAIRRAADARGERWALLASGDMSHRLQPDAPSGFHPDAHLFDEQLVAHVKRGDLAAAATFDEALRELAAEDMVESIDVARGALGEDRAHNRVLSYEGPFGVGYLVAVLHEDDPIDHRAGDNAAGDNDGLLLRIARESISAATTGRTYRPPSLSAAFRAPMGVFVTLHSPGHRLRGCVGRMELDDDRPFEAQLADVAVSAATRDPRFPAVGAEEIPALAMEISLLGHEEPCEPGDLDPATFGASVEFGSRRAVLLPEIEGINTAEEQLAVVLDKAGIPDGAPFKLRRFPSHKIKEPAPPGGSR